MPTTVLAAGDHFVLPELLARELRAATPVGTDLDIRQLRLPWPHTPFGKVAEVDEASGTEEELIEELRGVRICVTQMAPLTERVLAACPDLELFCVSRGGPVNANLEAATRHGVAVCYAPGRSAVATAEHTLALISPPPAGSATSTPTSSGAPGAATTTTTSRCGIEIRRLRRGPGRLRRHRLARRPRPARHGGHGPRPRPLRATGGGRGRRTARHPGGVAGAAPGSSPCTRA
ncbi:hypothetical protein LT493_12270 [Streptomyces tricolor]|nr:hypothetical protein [Streptomyces tricolor]